MAARDCRPAITWFPCTSSTAPAGDRNAAGQVPVPAESSKARWVDQPMSWRDRHSAKNTKWELLSLVGAEMIIINEIRD